MPGPPRTVSAITGCGDAGHGQSRPATSPEPTATLSVPRPSRPSPARCRPRATAAVAREPLNARARLPVRERPHCVAITEPPQQAPAGTSPGFGPIPWVRGHLRAHHGYLRLSALRPTRSLSSSGRAAIAPSRVHPPPGRSARNASRYGCSRSPRRVQVTVIDPTPWNSSECPPSEDSVYDLVIRYVPAASGVGTTKTPGSGIATSITPSGGSGVHVAANPSCEALR